MSPLDAMRAVMVSALDASTSHVLLVWASHVNEAGRAWPSVGRLAERTRLSTSSVKRSLKLLRASGVLVPEGESAASTTIYRLDLVALDLYRAPEMPEGVHSDTPVHSEPRSTVTPPPVHSDTPGGSPWTSPRSTVTPEEDIEEVKEEDREEDTHTAPPADPPPAIRESVLVSPVERPPVADDWTQLAEHYARLPGCMKPRDRKTGNGEHLTTILRKAGSLAAAVNLLEWWMYAPGARQLRTGSHDGSESDAAPVYGLKTLARPKNTDGYLEQAASWAKQRNPPRRKLSADAPSLRSLSIPEQRARDIVSDGPTPIQRKLAEQAAKRAKDKP